MIEAEAVHSWRSLQESLRPFVARRVATPADVDDVLQDVFLRMQRGLGGLRDNERIGPLAYRIARSAIVDHRRKSARRDDASAELQEKSEPSDPNEIEEELATYVAPFVALLPSPYREAVTLTDLEGLSQKEAARMLGLSASGMRSRVQRGRAQLRELIQACCAIALDPRGRVIACEPKASRPVPCECFGSATQVLERSRSV
jgi:RNA polymerase sigma-70 factor (ECF subfamily)